MVPAVSTTEQPENGIKRECKNCFEVCFCKEGGREGEEERDREQPTCLRVQTSKKGR